MKYMTLSQYKMTLLAGFAVAALIAAAESSESYAAGGFTKAKVRTPTCNCTLIGPGGFDFYDHFISDAGTPGQCLNQAIEHWDVTPGDGYVVNCCVMTVCMTAQ